MAKMFPSTLPTTVRDDPGRRAEMRVFDSFQAQLSDDLLVFYSVAWLNKGRRGTFEDGEADFVVAHPELGILVIEVKGGGIEVDGHSGQWMSIDRRGEAHGIKDPFDQARRSKHALLNKLRDLPALRGRWIEMGQAVVLPDCPRAATALGPDAPLEVVAFADDLSSLGDWILRVFEGVHSSDNRGLGEVGIQELERLLAPTLQLRTPLSIAVREDDSALLSLTEDQFRVLDLLSRQRRVAVSGGAGSGKSMLAVEKARRLAREGFRTLFVCFNQPLAAMVGGTFGDEESLAIHTFHGLCKRFAEKAGLAEEGWVEDATSEYFSEKLPNLLLEALGIAADERFDAIVVDEGQDFEPSWWDLLELTLEDVETGVFYVFYDEAQSIYGRELGLPADLLPPITLDRNLRNTGAIHALARRFRVGPKLEPDGPEGRPVEYVEVDTEASIKRELSRILHRLITEEGFRREEVCILTGHGRQNTALAGIERIGAFRCGPLPAQESMVVLETVRRFKGLDSPVVILVELETILDEAGLLYVAITRARSHLVVLAGNETISALSASP